jgi:hypothetical protein
MTKDISVDELMRRLYDTRGLTQPQSTNSTRWVSVHHEQGQGLRKAGGGPGGVGSRANNSIDQT